MHTPTLARSGSRVRVSFTAHILETANKEGNFFYCPGGGIGRRARFRCVCREACRFESCSGHYLAFPGVTFVGEVAELVDALL